MTTRLLLPLSLRRRLPAQTKTPTEARRISLGAEAENRILNWRVGQITKPRHPRQGSYWFCQKVHV